MLLLFSRPLRKFLPDLKAYINALLRKSDFLKSDKAGLVSTQIWDELKEIWKSKAGFDADAYLT